MTRWLPLLLCAMIAVGCTPEPDPEPVRDTPVEIRSDTELLTTRFPAIGTPDTVTWVTWNSASSDVPGPTTYWIDAVATLPPQTTTALVTTFQPAADGKTPSVHDMLRSAVPPGPFLTGAALDTALSTSGWAATAYLDRERNQLVLSAIDD